MHRMNKEAYRRKYLYSLRAKGIFYSVSFTIATMVEQLQSWTAQVHNLILYKKSFLISSNLNSYMNVSIVVLNLLNVKDMTIFKINLIDIGTFALL